MVLLEEAPIGISGICRQSPPVYHVCMGRDLELKLVVNWGELLSAIMLSKGYVVKYRAYSAKMFENMFSYGGVSSQPL